MLLKLHNAPLMSGTGTMPTASSPYLLKGGAYSNPRAGDVLTGQAIANCAKSVWAAYPDASLEIILEGAPERRSNLI
jgi:hypothetical protein